MRKANVELILDGDGEPLTTPDDVCRAFGRPAIEWIQDAIPKGENDYELYAWRIHQFTHAAILAETAGWDPLDYRHPPIVIRNYEPIDDGDGHGTITHYYVFKNDNNGTTFRVRGCDHEPGEL